MTNRKWPGTDLESSPIGLGGAMLGSTVIEADAFRLMDEYVDSNGNMVDTAQVYANWLPEYETSISETTIGRWMRARNNRERLIVTTKGAHPIFGSMDVPRMSEADIREDLEGSLRRLQVNVIDMYWLHRDDEKRSVGEVMETLNGFVQEGKIRYFGCSNWTTIRVREAQQYAEQHGLQGFSGNQMMWSLPVAAKDRISDSSLVPMDSDMYQYHLDSGLAALPYTSQAQGVFTKWAKGTHRWDDERIAAQYRSEENVIRFQRANQLAGELSLPISQIVLAYLINQPFFTVPIVGCQSSEQLRDSMSAAEIRLSPAQLAYLENGNEDA